MAYETKISASLEELVTPLRRLFDEGGNDNFIVLVSAPDQNYYVQATGARGGDILWLEAVSNQFLDSAHWLNDDQVRLLQALGWKPPGEGSTNFHREWDPATDSELVVVAGFLMQTLVEVYGMSSNGPVQVELCLE